MPKQDFTINTAPAFAGDVYGLAFTNSQRLTYSTEAAMTTYGVGVLQGAKANTIKVGVNPGPILGVTIREDKLEAALRPSDGTVLIPIGQPLAVMLEGAINVLFQTAITGKAIGVNATGQFGAVGGDYVEVTNATAIEYPIAAGSVGAIMLSLAPVK